MSSADILAGEAFSIADAAVVSDIETNGISMGALPDGRRIYDVRPMLDPREQPPEVLDMVNQAVSYGMARGLLASTDQAGILAIRSDRVKAAA
jgi:hypothetical protein